MTLQSLRRRFEPFLSRAFHFYWRFARGATLGAFALVIDREGRIFLIKHSYVSGWHLPGGGVETGETLRTALARELMEEGNIRLTGEPVLHGLARGAPWRARLPVLAAPPPLETPLLPNPNRAPRAFTSRS